MLIIVNDNEIGCCATQDEETSRFQHVAKSSSYYAVKRHLWAAESCRANHMLNSIKGMQIQLNTVNMSHGLNCDYRNGTASKSIEPVA